VPWLQNEDMVSKDNQLQFYVYSSMFMGNNLLCNCDVCDYVLMHETAFIKFAIWQVVQINFLMLQH